MRTYVDAGVLIHAARGQPGLSARALAILGDPARVFVASPFVRLEVLPKPLFLRRQQEVEFYRTFFDAVAVWVDDVRPVVDDALRIAGEHGLAAMDALHVACARALCADELVTAERPTSPLCRCDVLRIRTILLEET
ncbi:MAG: type II toxin-antitoxin system VapC family toxin [Deltaproteobacteria bacterium]|nr:type II toxin-antitoxin system VapC family toxin [Deltaproteobacteria bacterium]